MAKSVIAYDRLLPEIPSRRSWEKPTCFLVKDPESTDGWRIDTSGRRPSKLLLVAKLRRAVDTWRDTGYPGASDVSRRLFEFWFDDEHEVAHFPAPFRFHFCQREAVETLVYLVEVARKIDCKTLIEEYASIGRRDSLEGDVEFQTTLEGGRRTRQIRRYFAELDKVGVQYLPPEDLPRYGFKLATGSGKTWVMAMLMVWSYFHKKRVPSSTMSSTFLVVAPGIIVYQRLAKDLGGNKIFNDLPLVPPEWRPWNPRVILRSDNADLDPAGTIVVTNIDQIREARESRVPKRNPVGDLLGAPPPNALDSDPRSLLERLKGAGDLLVFNDEAHHVHDDALSWSRTLLSIHAALPNGLALWLDFSATPKDRDGMYYPWVICDYPLADAVEDRIVKAPLVVTLGNDAALPKRDPEQITRDNVTDKYGYWIHAAVRRWREHATVYGALGTKPVLFVMAEKNVFADAIGRYLVATKEFGLQEREVLVIHTDAEGEITKGDLEKAREAARDIDKNDVKVIVSVMMLREGWDVRNVSVVLGLRPFEAKRRVLPEQVIGRGLRLMSDIGPDRTQTLEVLGTPKLLSEVREQLEAEGVGVGTSADPPSVPVRIAPVAEKLGSDITIPLTRPRLSRNMRRLSAFDPTRMGAIFEQIDLTEEFRLRLRVEFATTETPVHEGDANAAEPPIGEALLATITNKVIQRGRLGGVFAEVYPLVWRYIIERCFGRAVDVDNRVVRTHLARLDLQDGIAKYLARKLGELTIEACAVEFENEAYRLSDTKPFAWRRNLPPVTSARTVFNYVATYNDFEREFALFLDRANDVTRFASLGTTEQGQSGTQFKVEYLKPSGAIGFYHPDWVLVQAGETGETHWIVETKGREWEGTKDKDRAIHEWCQRTTEATGVMWRYARVNQVDFEGRELSAVAEILVSPGGAGLFDSYPPRNR